RKNFGDALRRLIAEYKLDPSNEFQVLFLDIRSFKNINDTLGHTIGDKVLTIAAKRFVRMLDVKDTVARIGGDEFAIILRGLGSTSKAEKVARRIYQNITQPFSLSGNSITVDINIGIAPCDVEYDTPEEILRDADIAMHYAKEKGNGLAVFTKELRDRFLERVRLEMDLRYAVDRNELALHYQPIISLSDGRLVGFEALLRWYHSELGMIPPNRFVPIAEDSGLIKPITVWILAEAGHQLAKWQSLAPDYSRLMVSINISGKHLGNNDLIHDVEGALALTKIDPSSLKLEITESAAMENPEHTVNMLNSLKDLGVQLSIDDFGTGYSSLSHLHKLPFDTLKIDRSFVSSVGEAGENSEILQTIISLAKNLKMRVVAEGIETESQLRVLQNLGCDLGQGYLLAKPKSREETEKLLYQRPTWLPDGPADHFDSHISQTPADAHLPVF
ncbi:MAG TPA: bifunctional diguanylate cyclase/phosphodiesterase, partial [Pyrinomonadaceae bacterium]